MISKEVKRNIAKDWREYFPNLSVSKQNKLYAVCGPFIFGIQFQNISNTDYRPIFIVYPLWSSDVKECFAEPILMKEICNEKGLQLNIPYAKYADFILKAVECTKNQIPALTDTKISINQIFKIFENQLNDTLVMASPVSQAKIWEAKLYTSIYVEDTHLANQILNDIYNVSKSWPSDLFNWKYGAVENWYSGLQMVVANPNNIIQNIDTNNKSTEIAKLRSFRLII